MKDKKTRQPSDGVTRVARFSFLTSFTLFAARLRAYLRMVDDLKVTRANIERAEKAAADIRSVQASKRSTTTGASSRA